MIRLILIFVIGSLMFAACFSVQKTKPDNELPKIILWVWERPEDLRFLSAEKYGVAFLAQTLTFSKQAFQILHKQFPNSEWTKKTPYYFGNTSQY